MNIDQSYMKDLPVNDDIQKLLENISKNNRKIEELIVAASTVGDVETKTWKSKDELKALIKQAILQGVKDQIIPDFKLFKLKLRETETLHFFEIISTFALEGTMEAEEMSFYNDAYEKYQERKEEVSISNAETQTPNPCSLNRSVQTKKIHTKETGATVTEWDMFDSFKKLKKKKEKKRNSEDKQENFKEASQLCQRVLASNCFNENQMTFMTKHQPSRFISYSMEALWEMKEQNSGEVTCICTNPKNKKIVAVGYGDRGGKGLVCIWNAKNPHLSERKLQVDSPVTCMDFCKSKPRYLAFTSELGEVLIVDISLHRMEIIPLFRLESKVIKEPEWAAAWIEYEDLGKVTERLMTVGHNGEVMLWDPLGYQHKMLAELTYTQTPHQNMYVEELGPEYEPMIRNFFKKHYVCHTIELDPSDRRTYYITTNQGSVLTCKTHIVLGDMEVLPAHRGAVLGMKHSPFTNLVFLTHGADYTTKIWVKGIKNPVLVIQTLKLCAILCSLWSPSHSSCFVSVSREELCFWDIGRSVLDPMKMEKRTKDPYFSTGAFNKNGTSLYVGLTDGTVITYRMNDMPHPPYLPVNHLLVSLKKALGENTDLQDEVDEILSPTAEFS